MPFSIARYRIAILLGMLVTTRASGFGQSNHSAYVARIRSPGGALVTPSLAAIASQTPLGLGVHLQVGFGTETMTGVAYGLAIDIPARAGMDSDLRFGLSAGSVEGFCDERVQIRQYPCSVGHFFGINALGRIATRQLDTTLAGRTMSLGWSADVGYGDVETNTATAGIMIPAMLSFRSSRRTSASESDPLFTPRTTVFLEPGISVGRASGRRAEIGIIPQVSIGVSVLDIGPGFGFSGTARKWSGTDRIRGALSVSWHARRNPR